MSYYLALAGGFLIHIIIGTVYITGNISVYIASYLQSKGHDITLKDLSIILPLQVLGTTISLLFGSYLTTKYNPWITVILGNSIVILSVFSTSFITTYAGYVLVYGILFGIGVGITYTTPLICSWSHFPNHKGRISGIIISGFGFGSSIFNLVSTKMINPDNKKPEHKFHGDKYFDSDISDKLPSTLRWLALIYLIISVIGICLLKRPKKNEQLVKSQKNDECPSIKAGIKTKMFWVIFAMGFCSIMPGIYLASAYKSFGKEKINDDEFLTIVGSVGSIFNGSFRYFWGQVMDKTSFKISYSILLALQAALIVTLYYIASIKALYLIWISLILCCEGGHFSLYPTIIARMYGKVMGAKIYGILFYCFGSGSITGFLIQFYLVKIIGYQGLFIILAGFTAASLLILLLFFKEVNIWLEQRKLTEISTINPIDREI
ncbi:hypothetical protein SteCoe_7903 [Stentor coeruleus]|uniref:Major facilitator superfamily (MFS) profile domain-containing protein n=1 Tax=Stentor coeruleus TaxID=5963 RepID=A0A1R2CLD2_9CILI|nr:hypothetical protein SteCoe_7903 [Stentor coeruleus]